MDIQQQSPNPQNNQSGPLEELTKEWNRLRAQKSKPTGGLEARVLLNLAFGAGEHQTVYQNKQLLSTPVDANKLALVFNLIDVRVNKLIGRLCSLGGTYKTNPDKREPKAFAEAEVGDRMIKALDKILDQPSKTREIMFWLLYGGVAFEYNSWIRNSKLSPTAQYSDPTDENPQGELLFRDIPASTGQPEPVIMPKSAVDQQIQAGRPKEHFEIHEEVQEAGEVGSEIFGPLNVFIDQGVKSIAEMAPDQTIMIATPKTWGWMEENYPGSTEGLDPDNNIQIVSTSFDMSDQQVTVAGMSLKDIIPVVQGSRTADDPPMNVVVEAFWNASTKNPHGRKVCFVPGKKILYDGPNPYEAAEGSPEIPIVDYHFKPVTTSFWTKDYVTDLIAPQRFINKRMSQLGEQANASIYDKVLLGTGINPEDVPADYPGMIKNSVADNGAPLVQRLPGPQLPGWFLESINLTTKMFNEIAGGADLMREENFPGQLRGPLAVPMLQEILDTEWGPLYEHLGERFAKTKTQRLHRVKQFYPPQRTLHYTDRNQRDEVFEFHTEDMFGSGTNFTVTVERGSLVPELRALREARVRERLASPLSVLYIDERTGRIDKSKIAADLQFGDVGRDSQEAQYRKLGMEIVGRLWQGQQLPPVLPFYNHHVMMDELEAAMATTEFLEASPQLQQMFFQRWEGHRNFLVQAAEQQAQTMQNQQMAGAIQQGVQQASAEAAAFTVKASLPTIKAQIDAAAGTPRMLQTAFAGPDRVKP